MTKKAKDQDFRQLEWAFALGVIGAFLFWPALNGDWFANWDDGSLILGDGRLRNWSGLEAIWLPSTGVDYWPLSSTFLWIEWHLFSNQPLGYHVCSWALHVISGLLIWRLFALLNLRWGWLGSLLFIFHPLSVESVAWISETKNTLSLPFFLLSLIAYLDFDREGKAPDYWKSLGFYVVAMLAKTSVVMLPVVILLYDWWKRDRVTLVDLKRMAPYFAVALLLGLITVALQNHQSLSDAYKPRSVEVIFLCAGEAIFFYVGHFIFPYRLNVIYPRWTFDPPSILQLLTLPLLGTMLGLLWVRRAGWGRHALLGVGFFLVTVFPVIGFLNMTFMKISWVADHLVYLPMIGLIGLVVAAVNYCHEKMAPVMRLASRIITAVWLAALCFQTFTRAGDFRNEETLWTATLKFNPTCTEAYNNMGLYYRSSGRMYEAIEQFQKALKLDPSLADTHNNLGASYQFSGQPSDALREYQAAVNLKPDYAGMQGNLGQMLMLLGHLPEAMEHLEKSIKLDPNNPYTQNNMGYVLLQLGRPSEALPHFQQALRMQPDFVTAHMNLGNALFDLSRFSEAADEFEILLRIAPDTPDAIVMLQKTRGMEALSHKTD